MVESLRGLVPSPFNLQLVQEEQQKGRLVHRDTSALVAQRRQRRKRERQNRRDGRRQRREGR
jgi:hypothetical protein